MLANLDMLTRDVTLVSDQAGYTLSSKKPGAALGLQGLEEAYVGLLAHEKYGLPDSHAARTATRAALIQAYEGLTPEPEKAVMNIEDKVRGNMDLLVPRGRTLES